MTKTRKSNIGREKVTFIANTKSGKPVKVDFERAFRKNMQRLIKEADLTAAMQEFEDKLREDWQEFLDNTEFDAHYSIDDVLKIFNKIFRKLLK